MLRVMDLDSNFPLWHGRNSRSVFCIRAHFELIARSPKRLGEDRTERGVVARHEHTSLTARDVPGRPVSLGASSPRPLAEAATSRPDSPFPHTHIPNIEDVSVA
jgi:hypothetical protein